MNTTNGTTARPDRASIPTMCTACGTVRQVKRNYGASRTTTPTWDRLKCAGCGATTLHGRVDLDHERYGQDEKRMRRDCRRATRLLEELRRRGDVDIRWSHAAKSDEFDDWLAAWALTPRPARAELDDAVIVQQMRDVSRTWFLVSIDARQDRDRLVDALTKAMDVVEAPDDYLGAWRVDGSPAEWRGIRCH